MTAPALILASGSAIRRRILAAAGLQFEIRSPGVDETSIKTERAGEPLETIAMALAEAKACALSAPQNALVIGSDQILECDGEGFDKPRDMDEAAGRLRHLQGREHTLINAVAIVRDGQIIYRHIDRPRLVMRVLSEAEIAAYLAAAGPEILSSVGAYQVEALGSRLFERIEGDYFAVLGLSLFPVLSFLRGEGALAF